VADECTKAGSREELLNNLFVVNGGNIRSSIVHASESVDLGKGVQIRTQTL